MKQRSLLALALGCAVAFAVSDAQAQSYPSRPVTFITPAAAGNGPDVITRLVADRLTQMWKQPIVVMNRPGAGGLLAAQAAADVEKDGYSLYVTTSSTYTVLPIMQEGKMPVDLQTAFVPIGLIGEQPMAVSVNKNLPVTSIAELVSYIKAAKDGVFFAGTNRGSTSHLTGELFRERAQLNMSFVHATGAAVSLADVIAGRIPIIFEGLPTMTAGLANGGIRMLAVAAAKRLPNMPDVPTIDETVPGVIASGWTILMAPAGTPRPIIDKVSADLRKVLAMPDLVQRFQVIGTYTRDFSPEETAAFMRSEERLWWPVVRRIRDEPEVAAKR